MSQPDAPRSLPLAAGVDTAIVVAFVAIGRRNHDRDEAISGLVATAAPFVIGLAVAWVAWRVWRRPVAPIAGVSVWLTTLTVGMLLRRFVFDDGTAASFVVVAAVFLALLFLLWQEFLLSVTGKLYHHWLQLVSLFVVIPRVSHGDMNILRCQLCSKRIVVSS